MEILSNDALWGIFFFLLGIITLSQCHSVDQKIHYKMRGLRRLELYGRRELDTKATLPFNILCSGLTIVGSSFAIFGLIRFLGSVL